MLSKYRVLAAGILSPPAAFYLGLYVYLSLTRSSSDINDDSVFRLAMVMLAMIAPFLLTLLLAIEDRRRGRLTTAGKVGLALATLSLCLIWLPLRVLIGR
jgi:hypothetical protein